MKYIGLPQNNQRDIYSGVQNDKVLAIWLTTTTITVEFWKRELFQGWTNLPKKSLTCSASSVQIENLFSSMALIISVTSIYREHCCRACKAPFTSSASRRVASTAIHLAYLQVMYAYSSSCQLRHSQLRHCIVNDVISTGVVWWSLIATRTFWPFIIRSPIAYV